MLNSLSKDKILDVTKLKSFADNKFNFIRMTISLSDTVKNTVGKEENSGYQHFLLFPLCFPNLSSLELLKLKSFADNKFNFIRMTISLSDTVKNTVGKEENAGYQHFLLFPLCFPNLSSLELLKVQTVWKRINQNFLGITIYD